MNLPASQQESRLSVASPVGSALQTLIELELDFAHSQLTAMSSERDETVHQCRKAIKRMRAIAQLGVAIPGADPQRIDRRLHKAGRLLAPTRDAVASDKALAKLVASNPDLASLKRLNRIADSVETPDLPIDRVSAELDDVRSRLSKLFDEPTAWTFAQMTDGIEATYAAAVTRRERLERKHSDGRAHALRKDVQRLSHQLAVVRTLCADYLTVPLARLDELADALGEHHDLAVLRARLKTRKQRLPKRTYAGLKCIAKTQQQELLQRSLNISADLLSAQPSAFRDSLLTACADLGVR